MIESSVVKEVFLPDRGSCLCGKHFNDLTNSVLAFVREVQEIGERHGFLKAWLRKFSSEVYQNTIWASISHQRKLGFVSIILFPMV